MTMMEMEIANLAAEAVKFVRDKPVSDPRIRVAALQIAQHVLGQANAIEEANKAAAGEKASKPIVSGAFL